MYHKKTQRLVEICPQCFKSVDGSTTRLVSDSCGHKKCRVCLLQETNGCLKCSADDQNAAPVPPRKSVITSREEQLADDKGTCHIIQHSLQKDILFPTEIVKRSSSHFFHLKRLISERFFNETGSKADKNCGTDPEICESPLPKHIKYYCSFHKVALDNDELYAEHSLCEEQPPFACVECTKTFDSSSKLQRHMRFHSRKFQCPICSKNFKDNYAVKIHLRTHTGAKAYKCAHCGVCLAQRLSFRRHMAKHLGDRNFCCNECGLRFLTRPELKRHLVVHGKRKYFVCKICGAKFSFQRCLSRHAAIHSESYTPVPCDFCESTFKRVDNLRRHVRNTHSDRFQELGTPAIGCD